MFVKYLSLRSIVLQKKIQSNIEKRCSTALAPWKALLYIWPGKPQYAVLADGKQGYVVFDQGKCIILLYYVYIMMEQLTISILQPAEEKSLTSLGDI